MEAHPFLLENYLINHVFRVGFPLSPSGELTSDRPYRLYLRMCLEFAVVKGLLIGMAGCHREAFSAAHVVKLMQSFAKSIEHDRTVAGTLNWKGLSDPNCVAALLRN